MKTLNIVAAACLTLLTVGHANEQQAVAASGEVSVSRYRSIQEALNANPGRMIYVPAGDYTISEKIRIRGDNAGLFGPGRIIQTNPDSQIIEIDGAAGVQIRELTLTRAEGKMDTKHEAVVAIKCRDLVLENLRVLDNRTRSAAIAVRECTGSQVRGCLVRNYMRITVDDRTAGTDWGYAFKCIDGTGIEVRYSKGTLLQGNRVIEQNLLPTLENQKKFDLGKFVKKNAKKGAIASQQAWDAEFAQNWHQGSAIIVTAPEVSDCTQILGNYIENAAQGIDLHSDHVIVAQNIINNSFMGMKAMHGSRHVLIIGNQFSKNDLWSIGLMPGAASHAAMPARDGKPAVEANVDGGSIIANNIISDFGYGHSHWIWGGKGAPLRFDRGQKPENPPLTDVIIQGNIVYDTGRDQVIVDGQPKIEPPRYKYAVIVESGSNGPRGLHFSNNILHPGAKGVSNVELKP
ncbi:MAG: right-handed parallel beta-helix repeat-containing protein [Verrucomicrobia bacterium]|nr:right-handed parallel beta-helix repeat-containing protein [Verrucomicrobiota bacterium]